MITGFEKYTDELNEYESSKILPLIISGMETKKGKDLAITNKMICKLLKLPPYNCKITEARVRKIVAHIRINGLVPNLIATSKGYYIAETEQEMDNYIESLDQRINAITVVRDALFYQKNQSFK